MNIGHRFGFAMLIWTLIVDRDQCQLMGDAFSGYC